MWVPIRALLVEAGKRSPRIGLLALIEQEEEPSLGFSKSTPFDTAQTEAEIQGLDGHRELEGLVLGLSPANGVLGAERLSTSIWS